MMLISAFDLQFAILPVIRNDERNKKRTLRRFGGMPSMYASLNGGCVSSDDKRCFSTSFSITATQSCNNNK
jgi:hypothetical protein